MSYRKVLLFTLSLVFGCSAMGSGEPGRSLRSNPESYRQKLDAALLADLQRFESGAEADRPVETLIRTRARITPEERSMIEERGGKIGSIMGDVLTATIPVRALPDVAGLDFVVFIEKAKKPRLR
jgi:hypothetical protein